MFPSFVSGRAPVAGNEREGPSELRPDLHDPEGAFVWRAYPETAGVAPCLESLMLSTVQSSPVPTTALAGPTTTAGLDAIGSAKPPITPGAQTTTATLEANLGSAPPAV